MKINVKAVDVYWTADGDLFITDGGKMHLASYDYNEVLEYCLEMYTPLNYQLLLNTLKNMK